MCGPFSAWQSRVLRPSIELDFTIDIEASPALQPVGKHVVVTRLILAGGTTRVVIFNALASGYQAFALACGHMVQ